MNILVIDPHGTKIKEGQMNVHARNSLMISDYLEGDLLYDEEKQLKEKIFEKQYDVVVFVHTSPYVKVNILKDYLRSHLKAKFFLILQSVFGFENRIVNFILDSKVKIQKSD